jgi:hypothetical protein
MLKKKRPQPRRFSGLWFVKKITLLVILSGIALFLYAGGTFGYSYYQAKVGQGELRSLFGITGNGSVDSDTSTAKPTPWRHRSTISTRWERYRYRASIAAG